MKNKASAVQGHIAGVLITLYPFEIGISEGCVCTTKTPFWLNCVNFVCISLNLRTKINIQICKKMYILLLFILIFYLSMFINLGKKCTFYPTNIKLHHCQLCPANSRARRTWQQTKKEWITLEFSSSKSCLVL